MDKQLIEALLALLPDNLAALKYLRFLPDAVEIVKDLIASTNRIIAILKAPGMLDEQQRQRLDARIDAHSDELHWQPDATIIDPPNPDDDRP